MNSLVSFILNTLAISIPEEFFITYIILYFLKVFRITNRQFFDIHDDFLKNMLQVFLKSVLPMAFLSNILLAFNVSPSVTPFVGIFATTITIIWLCNIKKVYRIIITFSITVLGMTILSVVEGIIYQCVFTVTKTNMDYFLVDEIRKIVLTLFARLIEYIFIVITIFNKNKVIKTNIIKQIIRSKALFLSFFIYILINASCFILVFKSIIIDNILNKLGINMSFQIITTFLLLLWVCVNITVIWIVPTIIQMNEKYKNKYGRGLIK
jgi:hypothetical protein